MQDKSKKLKLPEDQSISIIDVSGIVYSRYYGMQNMRHNGFPIGAIFGFCNAMLDFLEKFRGSIFVAALDSSRHTFRREMYPEYKSHRKETPEDLRVQWEYIMEACECFGLHIEKHPGFEADDIIASYVKQLNTNKINIISHDKDLAQLLVHKNVKYYNHSTKKFIDRDFIEQKYDIQLEYFLDYLSLLGDKSDNVPGVSGIGPKTASALIKQFQTVENFILNSDALPNTKLYNRIKSNIDKAILSKKLIALNYSVPVDIHFTKKTIKNIDAFFTKFGMFNLIGKYRRLAYHYKELL